MDRDDEYYEAMRARDFRFDGKFFVGVKTTGIYCRPVCPAKPKRENVEFFASAGQAERAGYRPCLRCRPEAAPRSPAWDGKSAVVQRALRALADQDPAAGDEAAFAARFGVSARHLRRLFEAEVGRTPKRILLENRLDFARTLIVETTLPLGEIAHSAGFASIRRFNDAIRDRFQRPPGALRRPGTRGAAERGITLSLPFRPPFDWNASLAYYRSHGIQGLETFYGGTYARVFRFEGRPGLAEVTLGKKPHTLSLRIIGGETASLGRVARRVRRMFDLDSDPLLVANAFSRDPHFAKLHRRHPGLRSPRGWDAFEIALCSVLGQLVSIPMANRLVGQLVEGYGEVVKHPVSGAPVRLFPRPEVIAKSSLSKVGTTGARKRTLQTLCRRILDGRLSLDSTQDPAAFRAALLDIPGVGPWTAEYVSLRAIADTDAFPATDLVLKRALEADPRISTDRLKPWRGYAAAYLWHAHAREKETAK